MSGTPSPPAEPSGPAAGPTPDQWDTGLFVAWAVFTALCVLIMLVVPDVGAVAFHFVWISMSIVYGLQGWSPRLTGAVLAVVMPVTALAMASFIAAEGADWMELTEVPLMALVFLAMVWHVRRRQAALAASQAAVIREHRANEVKELFVRNCSHQMRTPITVARGYAEMARKQVNGPGGQEDLDVVVDELDKLAGLAGRLLMLADVYDRQFEWDAVDVGALVQRTAARWRPTTERTWLVETTSIVVEADERRLEAALDSLVENAIKFTVDGDTIALRCRVEGREVVLEVEDTGVGFERSKDPDLRTSGKPGTGLGLAIVRGVVEGHGGRLVVEHRPVGSLLRIVLPQSAAVPA